MVLVLKKIKHSVEHLRAWKYTLKNSLYFYIKFYFTCNIKVGYFQFVKKITVYIIIASVTRKAQMENCENKPWKQDKTKQQ